MATPELYALQSFLNNLDDIPYCTGSVPLDPATSTLFYQSKDSRAEILNFTKPTDQGLHSLSSACEPATFGRAQKDVLDECYRKAGKMDVDCFAINFCPIGVGILEIVSDILFRGRIPEKSIRLELYKLNGPHVDTPRSDTMVASLVVVLPTVHQGGSLIIRHNGKEWTFDSSKAVNSEPTPHAAFVAFFSDVEHEVITVSSGYRVTLTYNLYLKKNNTKNRALVTAFEQTEKGIENALYALFKNPAFLPAGGILGFGLAHKYPFNQDSTNLSDLEDYLKGTDAVIKRACDSLSLSTAVKAVYQEPREANAVLLDHFAAFGDLAIHSGLIAHLKESGSGLVVNFHQQRGPLDCSDSEEGPATPIIWAKPLAKTNSFSSTYLYGNESILHHAYGEICLVATIPPAQERVN